MDAFQIQGPTIISGETNAAGSKNSALPILAGCLLTEDEIILENVPDLRDIRTMLKLLDILGRKSERQGPDVIIKAGKITRTDAPYELVSTMRASISVLGPLVAKEHEAKVSLPGGCAIGPRPIDLHLKGLEALGATIETHHGDVSASTDGLKGQRINLGGPFGSSVLATDNVMMAAALAEGETIIESAAREPEVVDACNFLKAMGAKIEGIGSSVLKITGVQRLHGCRYKIIPDRIETGTLLAAAACTGGSVFVKGARADHLDRVLELFRQSGCQLTINEDGIGLSVEGRMTNIETETLPYPGFPTDMQPQLMAMMALADGISVITEKIYPDRFIHVQEFARMGADIHMEGASAVVRGVQKLEGAPVMASDLRAGAALVIAALAAEGESLVRRIYHVDRGYEKLENKLEALGAKIVRVKD